jgi:hypothetical protein
MPWHGNGQSCQEPNANARRLISLAARRPKGATPLRCPSVGMIHNMTIPQQMITFLGTNQYF